MDKNQPEILSEIFKGLSHSLRVKIVMGLLQKHECNVSTIVEKLSVPQPTVSQHLHILKSCGIIEGFRNGNQICYKIVNEQVRKIFSSIGGQQ